MYVPISESGTHFYSEGFVVRFFKDDGTNWGANFFTGYGIDEVFKFSICNLIVVFAGGIGYVMDPNFEKPVVILESFVKFVFQTKSELLICIDDTNIQIFDPANCSAWFSDRISLDGFKEITFEGDLIIGMAYNPINSHDEWKAFSFNIDTKEIIGGSFNQAISSPASYLHLDRKTRENKGRAKSHRKYWWSFWS